MNSTFVEIRLEEGQILFKAGEPADKLYFIQSGTIAMADKNTGAVFATLREGDSFGEQTMLQGGIRGATALAGNGTLLLEITAEGLRVLLKTNSPILTAVFEAMMLQQNMHNSLRLNQLP
jgi:CRP-like cAMP-binding protein